jgi:4-alpha-glucanotransferase
MHQSDPAAVHAAERHGIESGYWDIFGNWHETSPALRDAILASLHVDPAAPSPAPPVDPVYVLTASASLSIDVRPEHDWPATLHAVLDREDGQQSVLTFATAASLTLPGLPLGYHHLSLSAGSRTYSTRIIVCPERAWLPDSLAKGCRRAGLAVCLWGLRSAGTWGCGDFTALERLIDWAVDSVHASYIALNPLHAIHNRQPFNTSPYLPNSLHYRNPIYLDIDRVEDVANSPACRELRASPAIARDIADLNASEFVDYERVYRLKLQLLSPAFDWFVENHWNSGSPRAQAFRQYIDAEGELLAHYALYSALDREMHRRDPNVWSWPDWSSDFRDPHSPAVDRFRQDNTRAILFHQYLQWLTDQQASAAQRHAVARGMEIGLLHDLPLATDRCGAELWANRPLYVEGCRVGAPPDDFSPSGQDWSFPPPNRQAHRTDGYRTFAGSIRHSARHGGALRIDHAMRLFRLYWIPDGFSASEGTYVRDHYQDLLRVLALESVRNRILIVGEDLGTVEPWMREALADAGILSYRLFFFEKHPDGTFRRPAEYPVQALVSSTTHDLPTLTGFWSGRDIDVRYELSLLGDDANRHRIHEERRIEKHRMLDALISNGFLPQNFPRAAADGPELTGDLHNAITGFLASTPSLLLTLNQEDLTKEADQQNVPATTWQYPNWRRKMRFSIEELSSDPRALAFAAMFRNWLDRTGRANPAP